MMRRADSAPARCPAERGRPRDVAQRPLPSEMMAMCKPGVSGNLGFSVMMSCVVRCCILFTSFSAAGKVIQTTLYRKVHLQKNLPLSALAGGADQRLHVVQVAFQCAPARCCQAILRLGQPP